MCILNQTITYSGSKWPLCKSCRNLQVRVLIISRDLDTDLSLVESGHVTWTLASDWSGANNLISQHYVAKMGNVLSRRLDVASLQ